MKFYQATNATNPVTAGPFIIQFACYEMVGTWHGVYATADEKEMAALDAEVALKKRVYAITQEQYDRCLTTKRQASLGYAQTMASTTPTPGDAPPSGPAPIDTLPPASEAPVTPLETVEEAVTPVVVQKKVKAK